MALAALVAGGIGWLLARSDIVQLVGPLAQQLPPDRNVPFIADLWARRPATSSGSWVVSW